MLFSGITFSPNEELSELKDINDSLEKISGVYKTGINRSTTSFWGSEEKTESLIVSVFVKHLPSDGSEADKVFESSIGKEVSNILINEYQEIDSLDLISLRFIRSYNIGIAKGSRSISSSISPGELKKLIN